MKESKTSNKRGRRPLPPEQKKTTKTVRVRRELLDEVKDAAPFAPISRIVQDAFENIYEAEFSAKKNEVG